MGDEIQQSWRERLTKARAWKQGESPDAVLEALSMTLALELTGDLGELPKAETKSLLSLGRRAMLSLGALLREPAEGEEEDEDAEEEREALRYAAELARDGLRALKGEPTQMGGPGDGTRVPADRLVRLLHGDLDGFAAGSLAVRIRRSDEALRELRFLESQRTLEQQGRGSQEEEIQHQGLFLVAAAEAAPMRDPLEGRALASLPEPALEAFAFEDKDETVIAVYAADPLPIRIVAQGLEPESMQSGYFAGRVRGMKKTLRCTLHIGDQQIEWELPVGDA